MQIKFIQKLIDKIRKKDVNRFIEFEKFNELEIPQELDVSKLYIGIIGKNNKIKIAKGLNINTNLTIDGFLDDSVIEIGENFICDNVHFQLGQNHPNFGKITDIKIKIGSDLSWETGKYVTYNSCSSLEIGNDCMFAGNVTLFNTDAHPIFNNETNELINKVKGMKIGNHVWLGMNSTILKNSIVPDNSIVGWGAVFSKRESKSLSYCAFAGNPAKVVNENINWDKNGKKFGYIENKDKEGETRTVVRE